MRKTTFQAAVEAVQVKPGERLSPLHRKLMRSLERREKDQRDRRSRRKAKQ
jgi:hypothetical protein